MRNLVCHFTLCQYLPRVASDIDMTWQAKTCVKIYFLFNSLLQKLTANNSVKIQPSASVANVQNTKIAVILEKDKLIPYT